MARTIPNTTPDIYLNTPRIPQLTLPPHQMIIGVAGGHAQAYRICASDQSLGPTSRFRRTLTPFGSMQLLASRGYLCLQPITWPVEWHKWGVCTRFDGEAWINARKKFRRPRND
jgi:hypothetical protein